MPRVRILQAPAARTTVRQIPPFTESCLPSLAELSRLFRNDIRHELDGRFRHWPFDDRVFVWLIPSFRPQAEEYHEGYGRRLVELYRQHEIADFDRWALERL